MLSNLAIKNRLGVAGVVGFIMAVAAVAEHVDDHVALEPLPVIVSHLSHSDTRFRVVPVDVEDGSLHHAGDVCGIRVERASSGLVVKPIWLLITRWMVPPVV